MIKCKLIENEYLNIGKPKNIIKFYGNKKTYPQEPMCYYSRQILISAGLILKFFMKILLMT